MAKIEVVRGDDVEPSEAYPAGGCELEGAARTRRVSPDGYPLWLVAATLGPGSRLSWSGRHGEEAVFVTSGALVVAGDRRPAGSVLVLEAAAAIEADVPEPTEIVHVGRAEADGDGGGDRGAGVHLIGPEGVSAHRAGPHLSRIFADASCPTCSVSLHWSSHDERYHSSLHSHSEDELIHVLRGDIFVGRRRVGPGDTLAVRANTKYRFESGDEGYGFLNYSPAASAYIRA
jgi:hypothetical protein